MPNPGEKPDRPSARTHPRRIWGFRLFTFFVLPILALTFLEGTLRVFNYGYPTSFFIQARFGDRDLRIANPKFGWRFFGPEMARTPRPTVLASPKSTKTIRVFVFGESAAYGDPKPDFGLPRVLQTLLEARFPNTRFEVINAAMTGINSHVILPIARDCAQENGDIWVIYMGNNEVVGPFGSGTVFGSQSPSMALIRASLALKATRTGELLASLLQGTHLGKPGSADWEGMRMFVDKQVQHDAPGMRLVYAQFARNLADILETGHSRGVGIVLSTMVSNVKDCAPFGSKHRAGLSQQELRDWEKAYAEGNTAADAGSTSQALEAYTRAAKIDDHFAELHFRWARCCQALGQPDNSRRHFVLARDYDTLRFRADTQINGLIREAGRGRESERILLADSEQIFAEKSTDHLVGEEFLYEHVHFNFEGNYLLAHILAERVSALLPEENRRANPNTEWLTATECARRMAWTDEENYKALKSTMLRINGVPFTFQMDRTNRYLRLQRRLENLLPAMEPASSVLAATVVRQAAERAPGDWVFRQLLGDMSLRLHDYTKAEESFRQVTTLIPQDATAFLELGLLLINEGRPQDALEPLTSASRLRPDGVGEMNALALALTKTGRSEEAFQQYEKALRIRPDSWETHLNLGTALEERGQTDKATEHFRAALLHPASTPDSVMSLGRLALSKGWWDDAVKMFREATRLNPTDAATQILLGNALTANKALLEAAAAYREAVRLNPGLSPAHELLASLALRQGDADEAIRQATAVIQLEPNRVPSHVLLGRALLSQHKLADARLQLDLALRLEPTNQEALRYVMEVLRESATRH